MINLPPKLTPSELLCCEGLPSYIDKLLQSSCLMRMEGKWEKAEQCALQTVEASPERGTKVSYATALIHLADICRESNLLQSALHHCLQAYRIFRCQPSHYQRHNEAVAAYSLGVVHQSLENRTHALKWYQISSELFESVKEHWMDDKALSQIDSCKRVQRWMEAMSEYLTATLTQREAKFSVRIWVPIILLEDRSVVEQLTIEERDHKLRPNLKPFQVHPLEEGWGLSPSPSIDYDAQEIPDDVRWALDAEKEDHALVQWEESLDQADLDEIEELVVSDVGKFVRDNAGRIFVIRPGPRVIGGEDRSDEPQMGYVPALLRPTRSPAGAVPPAESPAPQPPRPSGDSIELYRELLSMVGGDRETAHSLVEYERRLAPDASLSELIERAIVRLIRDRQ